MKKVLTLAVAAATLSGAIAAQAYEAGDWILRAGAATVDPNGSGGDVLGALEVDVDDDTQLSIIPVYMVTNNLAIEVLAATPFKHDISVETLGSSAAETKHLPPTVSVQWYPRGGQEGWQPYLGAGLNYTTFFEEDIALEGHELELDDSFGLSAQVGADFPLNENWALNVGVWWIDIDTDAKVSGSAVNDKFTVEIDPWVYNVGIAYKF